MSYGVGGNGLNLLILLRNRNLELEFNKPSNCFSTWTRLLLFGVNGVRTDGGTMNRPFDALIVGLLWTEGGIVEASEKIVA